MKGRELHYCSHWKKFFSEKMCQLYCALLNQYHLAAVCQFFLSSALNIWKWHFLQCWVQAWASQMFIKWAMLFWCWSRGDRWKGDRSHQGLIKNQLIFRNIICHRKLGEIDWIQSASFSGHKECHEHELKPYLVFLSSCQPQRFLSKCVSFPGKELTPRRQYTVTSCSITAQEEVSPTWISQI